MRIGEGSLAVTDASPEVVEVLARCERMRIESSGAFDVAFGARPEVPKRVGVAPIDPSGFVKGWAVARAASMLRAAGRRASPSAQVVMSSHTAVPTTRRPGWRVGIQHPWERDKVAAVVAVSDGAVATSGCYERGDHVFDPRTGRAVEGLASVTVVGADLATADAYATAVMVLGPDAGLQWLTTRTGYDGLAIRDDRTVVSTPASPDTGSLGLAGVRRGTRLGVMMSRGLRSTLAPCAETSRSCAASSRPPRERSRPRRQYVRKVTGVTKPRIDVAGAMEAAALEIAAITERLLGEMPARRQPPPTLPPLRRPEVRSRLGLEPFVGVDPSGSGQTAFAFCAAFDRLFVGARRLFVGVSGAFCRRFLGARRLLVRVRRDALVARFFVARLRARASGESSDGLGHGLPFVRDRSGPMR